MKSLITAVMALGLWLAAPAIGAPLPVHHHAIHHHAIHHHAMRHHAIRHTTRVTAHHKARHTTRRTVSHRTVRYTTRRQRSAAASVFPMAGHVGVSRMLPGAPPLNRPTPVAGTGALSDSGRIPGRGRGRDSITATGPGYGTLNGLGTGNGGTGIGGGSMGTGVGTETNAGADVGTGPYRAANGTTGKTPPPPAKPLPKKATR